MIVCTAYGSAREKNLVYPRPRPPTIDAGSRLWALLVCRPIGGPEARKRFSGRNLALTG